jgi:hypothetical protein
MQDPFELMLSPKASRTILSFRRGFINIPEPPQKAFFSSFLLKKLWSSRDFLVSFSQVMKQRILSAKMLTFL